MVCFGTYMAKIALEKYSYSVLSKWLFFVVKIIVCSGDGLSLISRLYSNISCFIHHYSPTIMLKKVISKVSKNPFVNFVRNIF